MSNYLPSVGRSRAATIRHAFVAAALCLAPFWSEAEAAPILLSQDWQSPGDNLLTLDRSTGLQWLDLSVSQFLTPDYDALGSYDYVAPLLAPGELFDGFRFATYDEVSTLLVHAGLSPIPSQLVDGQGELPSSMAAGLHFMSMFGQTSCFGCFGAAGSLGIIGELRTSRNVLVAGAFQHDGHMDTLAFLVGSQSPGGFGSYLVREADVAPVPEVGTLMLVGTGLAALSLRKRARRKL